MTTTVGQADLSPAAAADAAVHSYAPWVGLLQPPQSLPGTVPDGRARRRFLRAIGALLGHMLLTD